MSAIATVLAGMGHQVSGSDLKSSASLERLRAAGRDRGRSATTPPTWATTSTRSPSPPRCPATNPEVVAAHQRGIPVLRRAETLAAIAATRQAVDRRRHARQDHHLVDAGPGPDRGRAAARRSSSAARSTRSAPGAAWDEGSRAGGRGRRERRHLPGAAPPGRGGDQRGARPPRALRQLRGPARRPSPATWPRRPGRGWCAPTTPWPPSSAAQVGAVHLRDRRSRPTTAWSISRPGGRGTSFTLEHDGPRAGPDLAAGGRRLQRPQRHRRRRHGPAAGRRLRGGPHRLGPLRRGGPALRAPGRGRRRHLRRRLRPPAHRGGRRAGRGPRRVGGTASCASSSPTATAAPPRCGPTSPTPSARPTCWPSPTSTRPARRPDRA